MIEALPQIKIAQKIPLPAKASRLANHQSFDFNVVTKLSRWEPPCSHTTDKQSALPLIKQTPCV